MKAKSKPQLPVDIKLPERVLLSDGCMFVNLRTLDDLENFWLENKDKFEFACQGIEWGTNVFLREYEWVFGTSKAAVVRTVMRWNESGVSCEFYDFEKNDPALYGHWLQDQTLLRKTQLEAGLWSEKDEAIYQSKGWWQLKDIPGGCSPTDWFNPFSDADSLFDKEMPLAEVELALQEQTFDDWKESDTGELEYHDRESIEATISYWRKEQADGQGYYGDENVVSREKPSGR